MCLATVYIISPVTVIFLNSEFTVVSFLCCCSSFGLVTCPLSLDKKGRRSCQPPALNPDWVEGRLGGVFIVGKICSQVKLVFTIV